LEKILKNGVDIATILFALWAFITGIVDSDIHILVSTIFAFLIGIHAFLYKKMLIASLKGLRWKWALIIPVFMVIVITVVLE
jgi:hypothetical protein